jgi:hypothetical protein
MHAVAAAACHQSAIVVSAGRIAGGLARRASGACYRYGRSGRSARCHTLATVGSRRRGHVVLLRGWSGFATTTQCSNQKTGNQKDTIHSAPPLVRDRFSESRTESEKAPMRGAAVYGSPDESIGKHLTAKNAAINQCVPGYWHPAVGSGDAVCGRNTRRLRTAATWESPAVIGKTHPVESAASRPRNNRQ